MRDALLFRKSGEIKILTAFFSRQSTRNYQRVAQARSPGL